MANTISSNRIFGGVAQAVASLDTTGSPTMTVLAAGSYARPVSLDGVISAGGAGAVVDYQLEDSGGSVLDRQVVGAGASPARKTFSARMRVNGLVLRANDFAGNTTPTAAVTVTYKRIDVV